jgi:tetratricopeptide (TPR) repeat protein
MTKEMLTSQSQSFGLGFAVERGSDRFGHNGADEGFQAYLTAFANAGRGVAIMANSDNGGQLFKRVAAAVANEYGWTSFKTSAPPVWVKAAMLARVKGPEAAIAWYKALRQAGPASGFAPSQLNRMGYLLLREGRVAEAVKIFEANVELFPEDANVYDSLAEAYIRAGNNVAAIANYEKALQLDPKLTNAAKMLAQVRARGSLATVPEASAASTARIVAPPMDLTSSRITVGNSISCTSRRSAAGLMEIPSRRTPQTSMNRRPIPIRTCPIPSR